MNATATRTEETNTVKTDRKTDMQTEEYRGKTLVNRPRRGDGWHVSANGRVRWGTLAEVKADVDHLILHGHLPYSGQSWA